MSSIAETRKYYGLSQKDLAVYLSVSETHFKMAEQGRRSLPTTAFIKLAELQKLMYGKPGMKTAPAFTKKRGPENASVKALNAQYEVQLFLAQKARRTLEAMQVKHQQAAHLLQLVLQLKKSATSAHSKADALWLQIQESEATKALEQNGLAAQTFLNWKISCMDFAAKKALKMLNEI